MKKSVLTLALLAAPLSSLFAQRVVTDNFDRLEVHFQTPTLNVQSMPFFDGKADMLTLAGYQMGGEEGSPALPLSINPIVIPFCESLSVEVSNAVYDTINLSPHQPINLSFLPLQPSRVKSDTSALRPVVNVERYATDAFWGMPLASVEVMGVARDRRLANLTFSPLQVNPVTGQVVVCRSADITVRYIGSDEQKTRDHFNRHFTPAFSVGTTLNSLVSTKEIRQTAPVGMVVFVPNALYCNAVERFVTWKKKQGINVTLYLYENDPRETIAALLKSLYDEATSERPAPTYLLLVGDLAQFPSFTTTISSTSMQGLDLDHVTDLYYVTWSDGDYLPDCYQGRFSASDTATLTHIINKTLLYEQYTFSDDSYLARAALIAGEDNGTHQASGWSRDYAWVCSDPTMDYIAKTYVNHANGFDTVSYYKNNVDFAPDGVFVTGYCSSSSSASALRNLYSEGLGWINYSAHGDWDRWYKPSFTNSNVNSMSNNGKPSFMIGNCCLTNKFDKTACFGETLLRKKDNGGAVAYIGGTNSTLWDEDFYWSVGVRGSISNTMNTNYDSLRMGMYDRLFHTHSESFDNVAITAGAMVVSGNLSVDASSSRYKKYYWEIYELMGDPSLLPWLGRASDLQVDVRLYDYYTEVTVTPNAYVAIIDTVDNDRIVATAFADANGNVTFDFGRLSNNFGQLCLSVTAQGRKPHFKAFSDMQVGIDNPESTHHLSPITLYPNPASASCTVSAPGLRKVEVLDLTGHLLLSYQPINLSTYQPINLSPLNPGVYFVRLSSDNGVFTKKLIVQ